MAADSRMALRVAVVTALKADAALTAITGLQVVTKARAGVTTLPYIKVAAIAGRLFDTKSSDGFAGTVEIHTYSTRRGTTAGVEHLQNLICDALDGAALSVTGHALITLHNEFATSFEDSDGESFQGVQRFRFITDEA